MDFGLKNPPKSALGRFLGRLVAVLGRLGPSWSALETSWKDIEKLSPKKWQQKSAKNVSSGVFGKFFWGESSRARGRAVPGWWQGLSVRSPKLPFTTKKNKTTKLPLTIYHLTLTHAVARSAVADINPFFCSKTSPGTPHNTPRSSRDDPQNPPKSIQKQLKIDPCW